MPGVFDDEDLEPETDRRDKEFTLGSGTLLAIFFGLVILCGLCFGLGYTIGHRGVKSAAAAPTAPGEQEPLQANGAIPKPSAIAQGVVQSPQASSDASPASSSGPPPVEAAQLPTSVAQTPPAAPVQAVSTPAQQSQVHAAFAPGSNPSESQQPASTVHPALAQAATIMVQIAAVANPDDADVLIGALRKRSYPVSARHDPADNLIHVRVGPFATRAEADQWRMRLLNDGYNAIVQQ